MSDYPYTITFYSYKGGVGRTLLAANIGLLRARRGKTLLWDLDVEAPGLHRIGKLSPASPPQQGFFEWLIAWQAQPKNSRPDFAALAGLALQTPVAQNLYVLPACAEGARPAELYERIRWDGFLREDLGLGLALFRDALRAMANAGFETVILDARTGYTDIGGLLAMLLPHLTVLVGNYGRQNVLGLADVWQALTPATADAGSTVASRDPLPPLKRLLVASPIVTDRVDLVQAGQKVWKEAFGLLPTETLEVPFHPDLPFTEDLLAASQPDSPTALAYFDLDHRIEALRREILALTAQVDARAMAEPELGRRSTSARGKTFEQRVAQLLRLRGFEVQGETLVDANRIDLIATKKLDFGRSETWFVECKDYADNVGKDVVDTFKSWLDDPQARQRRAQGMIVASMDFAPAARAAAEAKNILTLTYADLERSLFDFSDYLRRIRARYEAGSLARWYVNQFVRLEKSPAAKPRELLPHALDWAAGTGSRLWLVLGDYGTGKSSFVERFAYELACRALDDPGLPVPLAINLRDYPSAVSLESLLQEHMRAELGLTVDPALLLHLLGAGRVLLLLDSFDEMGLAQAGRSMDEQLRLLIRAAASPGESALGNRILLTSRTHLFKDHGDARHAAEGHDRLFGGDSALGRSARAFDAVIDQLPLFTTDQIKDYLARRLGADEAERARKFIHDTYNLEALAEVPQLLDMMVASLPELMARGGDVSAGALYVTYTNQWLQRYRRKAQELSAEQLRSLLEWLARLLWARPENHIHYADLARSLHDMPDLPGGMDPQRVDLELRTAAFLVRNPEGQYRFSHRSFLEFFLARAILRAAKDGHEQLGDVLALPSLSPEVCSFVHDLCAEKTDADCVAAALCGILQAAYRRLASENALRLGYWLANKACAADARPPAPDLQRRWLPEGAKLAGAQLSGIAMLGLCLPGADLRGAQLAKAKLAGGHFARACLDGACLDDCELAAVDFSAASLTETSLQRAGAQRANLSGARCLRARAAGVDLSGCSGANSDWTGADMRDARLARGNFSGAVFEGVNLARASAVGAALPDGFAELAQVATCGLRPVFPGHGSGILACAYAPDGLSILTASDDHTARLWDNASGKEIVRFEGHTGAVVCCAFSPDGNVVLTGAEDGTARLWCAASGKELARLQGHEHTVRGCAYFADGRRILTCSSDRTWRLWDAASGEQIMCSERQAGELTCCAYSAGGACFLTGSAEGELRLWDAASGKEIRCFAHTKGGFRCCAFSPDGARVLAACENIVYLWDTATGKEIWVTQGRFDAPNACAFSADRMRIVLALSEGPVIVDPKDGKPVLVREDHDSDVNCCAFSPDSVHVLTGAWDNTARVWNAATGEEVLRIGRPLSDLGACAFSADGTSIVTAGWSGPARLWDAASGRRKFQFKVRGFSADGFAFSPDGRRILSASGDKVASVWDAATGAQLAELAGHEGPIVCCAYSRDGRHLVTGSWDTTARVWDAAGGTEIARLAGHQETVRCCGFSADGMRVITSSEDNTARLWDLASGTEILRIDGHGGEVYCCAFSPLGERLLTGSDDNTARIWNATTGAEFLRFSGHRGAVFSCAFSPDGARVLTGAGDNTARIWDATTGAELLRLKAHGSGVNYCAFSADGTRILTGSWDGMACLWDAASGAELMRYFSEEDVWFSMDMRSFKWRGEAWLTEQVVYIDPTLPPRTAPRHRAIDLPQLRADD